MKKNKNIFISLKKEMVLTVLMVILLLFFASWQVIDHLRMRREQDKVIRFLKKDISTALTGILNSQPRFGPIVLKDIIRRKIDDLMNSGKVNPLYAVAFFNRKNTLILCVNKDVNLPRNWYKDKLILNGGQYLTTTESYKNMAAGAGLKSNNPVLGEKKTVMALINLVSEISSENHSEKLPQNGKEVQEKVKKLLAGDYFKDKTVEKVAFLTDVSFLRSGISKDLLLRAVSLLFCIIAFIVFIRSLFNLHKNIKLEILLAAEKEKNAHFSEMQLVAAGLAHEIKNPLNIVRGVTQSVMENRKNERDISEKLSAVTQEVDRINSRLNTFLAYSNMKPPDLKIINARKIVQEVVNFLSVDADEKNISIELDMRNDKISADEDNFQQILFNLIHNAIKNTGENGRIVITSGISKNNIIWIEVADNGPGIPESAREDIFKPYFSLDSSGTGLGLAIVKQLTFKHGWDIKYINDTAAGGAGFRIEGIRQA